MKRLLEKLCGFLNGRFESDWEKKTGTEWKEWGKLETKDLQGNLQANLRQSELRSKRVA
jgi:hypothetical protein